MDYSETRKTDPMENNKTAPNRNKQKMLLQMLGARPIAFNPQLARLCGSIKAGLFLSQLLYWFSRTDEEWVYKTIDEFAEETALTRNEQDSAILRLKQLGFVEMEVRGVPPTRYFKLDETAIANQFVKKLQTNLRKSSKLNCGKVANPIYTEITTEIESYRLVDDTKSASTSSLEVNKRQEKCTNPNGHNKGIENSCVTNLEDLQKEFGKKFTNFPAQIKAQHQIFKAGFSVDDISKCANKLDKDPYWQQEGWDMITIAKKLSKGGKYAH